MICSYSVRRKIKSFLEPANIVQHLYGHIQCVACSKTVKSQDQGQMTKTQETIHRIETLIGHLGVEIIDIVYKNLSLICSPKDDKIGIFTKEL